MKFAALSLLLAGSVLGSASAWANSDDAKWVAQCLQDNKDATVDVGVVTKYCTCMNNKMDANETQSITQWEKSHTAEQTACDKESGWK